MTSTRRKDKRDAPSPVSRNVELYNRYREMLQKGEKVTYIVASLAEKYGICERKVYYLVKRLNDECNPVAP
jgi:hypothetical protein